MDNSDITELNDNPNHNDNKDNNESDIETISTNSTTTTTTPVPASSSSASSINSDSIFPAHTSPTPPPLPPTHPQHYPPYPYPYGYSWYPPPPPPANGEVTPPIPNWHYPYPMPPPPLLSNDTTPQQYYPPYPYYYPYYPFPSPSPYPTQTHDYDSQNAYPFCGHPHSHPQPHPHPHPLHYPYAVTPYFNQNSDSSRASSVPPHIFVTPSSDEAPTPSIARHHNNFEEFDASEFSNPSEDSDGSELRTPQVSENSVEDPLSQQIRNIEDGRDLSQAPQNENTVPLQESAIKIESKLKADQFEIGDSSGKEVDHIRAQLILQDDETETEDSSQTNGNQVLTESTAKINGTEVSEEDSEDSDTTPKDTEKRKVPLQAIKSVADIQVYNSDSNQTVGIRLKEENDDDVTTADEESEIFDVEGNEEADEMEFIEEIVEEEEEEEEEDHEVEDEEEDQEYITEDNLSIIYEEESEFERSSEHPKTVIKRAESNVSDDTTIGKDDTDNIEKQIEENDDNEEHEDSSSVTVRLPLKFSFSRTSSDENIATVEVGNSHIKERRNSLCSAEKYNSFSIAKIQSDSEKEDFDEDYDDCDVSVTISLARSSCSDSTERRSEPHDISAAYPIEDLPLPEEALQNLDSSNEDVTSLFSLNMRNKFVDQTITGNVTNNISQIADNELPTVKENIPKLSASAEEIDFFATLRATKMQAQEIKEKSVNYWGKLMEKKQEEEAPVPNQPEVEPTSPPAEEEIEDIWADREDDMLPQLKPISKKQTTLESATHSFWSTVEEITSERPTELNDEEVTLWEESNIRLPQASSIAFKCEDVVEMLCYTTTLQPQMEVMPKAQKAEVHLQLEEDIEDDGEEEAEEEKEEKEMDEQIANKYEEKEKEEKEEIDEEEDSEEAEEEIMEEEQEVEIEEHESEKTEEVKEEVKENEKEEEEEVDFWAIVEKAKLAKQAEHVEQYSTPQTNEQDTSFWEDSGEENEHKNEEESEEIIGEEVINSRSIFDPTNYPEEPREVDTDEEIDFWAEIEANRRDDNDNNGDSDDNVTFQQAATFWAARERKNSIDETPYKPVLPKTFPAKLPEEPTTVSVDVWTALEAARGEEPLIIDPELEGREFNLTSQPEDDVVAETASIHEPVLAQVWEPNTVAESTKRADNEEPDFWAVNECERSKMPEENITKEECEGDKEQDELEIKRSNYRKAMTFFKNSIDEQKEHHAGRFERGRSATKTAVITEEPGEWDSKAITQELKHETVPSESTKTENLFTLEAPYKHGGVDGNGKMVDEDATEYKEGTVEEVNPLPEVYVEPTFQTQMLSSELPNFEMNKSHEEEKVSVRDRISAFENNCLDSLDKKKSKMKCQSLSIESYTRQSSLSRNNSAQRSESEMEEEDSGVTDMNKQLSETDTESETFPELRKMTSYQRAATHSRLFRLLQEDSELFDDESKVNNTNENQSDEFQLKPSRRKIIHNVSVTRKQNPEALAEAETMAQRRERLSLPLRKNISIDADNPSTPNSPASPIVGQPMSRSIVSDQMVNELVQSLLLKSDSSHLRNLPMKKLQAAAKRVLEEELDSLENTSVDSTPNEVRHDKSYADYYNSWSNAAGALVGDMLPPKAHRTLVEGRRSPWTVRCPRILSSKTVSRDLGRVTESPEIFTRCSQSPECFRQSRESSVGKWKKA